MTEIMTEPRAGIFDSGNSFDVPWTDDGKDYLKQLGIFEEDLENVGSTHPGRYYQDVPLENNPEAYLDFLCRESMRKKKDTPRTWKTLSKKRVPVKAAKDFDEILSSEEGSVSQRSSSSSGHGKSTKVKVQGSKQEVQAITKVNPNEQDFQKSIQNKEPPRKNEKRQGKQSKALQLFPQRKQKNKNDKTKTDITSGIIKDCNEIEKSYLSEDIFEKQTDQGRKFKLTGWKKPWQKSNTFEIEEKDISSKRLPQNNEGKQLLQNVKNIADIEIHKTDISSNSKELFSEQGLGFKASTSISPLPDVLAQSSDLEEGFSPGLSSTRTKIGAEIHWVDNDEVFMPLSPTMSQSDGTPKMVYVPESQNFPFPVNSSSLSSSLSESQNLQKNYNAIPKTRLNQHGVKTLETVTAKRSEALTSFEVNECTTIPLDDPHKCALHAAAIGDLDLLKKTTSKLSRMECLCIRDEEGNNLLHQACSQGHIQCVEFLYKQNNSLLNNQNKIRLSPAACAIKNGQIECLDWLLENTSLVDEIREPALKRNVVHHAARYGQDGCLKLLIERLQNEMNVIEHPDPHGDTPAHLAAKYGQLTCLQTLVDHGIDVTKENKFGQTPCSVADLSNNRQCASYLTLIHAYKGMAFEIIRTESEHNRLSEEITTLRKCLQESLSTSATLIKMNQDILGSYSKTQSSLDCQMKTAKELCNTAEEIASENLTLKKRSNIHQFQQQDMNRASLRTLHEKINDMEDHLQRQSIERDKLDQDVINEQLTKVEDITRKLFTLTEMAGVCSKDIDQYDMEVRVEKFMRNRLQETSKNLNMNTTQSSNTQTLQNPSQIVKPENDNKPFVKVQPLQHLPKTERKGSSAVHHVYANTRVEEEKLKAITRFDKNEHTNEMSLNLNEMPLHLNEDDIDVSKETISHDIIEVEEKKGIPETPLLSPVASSSGDESKPSFGPSLTLAGHRSPDNMDWDYVDLKKVVHEELKDVIGTTDQKFHDIKPKNKLPTFLTKEEIIFNDDLQETVIGNSDFEDYTLLEQENESKPEAANIQSFDIPQQQFGGKPKMQLGSYKDSKKMLEGHFEETSKESKQSCEETPKKPQGVVLKEPEMPSPILQQLLETNVPLGLSQFEELTKESKRQTNMAIPNKISLRENDFKETYARQHGNDKDVSLDSDMFDEDDDNIDPHSTEGIQLFGERHYTCQDELMSYGDLTDSSDDYEEDEHDDFYPRGFSRFGERLPTIEEVSVMSDSTRVDTDDDSMIGSTDNDMGSTETLTGEPVEIDKPSASEKDAEMQDPLACPLDDSTDFPKPDGEIRLAEDNTFRDETDKAWYDMSDDDEVTQWHLKKEQEQEQNLTTETVVEHYTMC